MSRRYPFRALCEVLHVTPEDLKRRLGLDHRQLSRYLEDGLTEARADVLAGRLGLVALNVWPDMIDHAIEDTSKRCEECDGPFVPTRSDQRFCVRECRWRKANRESYRRRYQSDPEFKAVERLRVLSYQADPAVAEVRRRKARIRYRRANEAAA